MSGTIHKRSSIGAGLALCLAVTLASVAGCKSGGGEMAILDMEPRTGGTQGDQFIKFVGQNFRRDIGYTVYFGTKKANQVTIVDTQTLLAVTPSGVDPGTVDVMIRADDGNAFRLPQAFKFEQAAGGDPLGPKKEEKGNLAF
jgi:IPT/TIG domain